MGEGGDQTRLAAETRRRVMANLEKAMSVILCIEPEDASVLARLRLVSGLEVAEGGAAIWLRALHADESTSAKLAGVPARERYECLEPDRLRSIGARIPAKTLPALKWTPLTEWLQIKAPTAALPARLNFDPQT